MKSFQRSLIGLLILTGIQSALAESSTATVSSTTSGQAESTNRFVEKIRQTKMEDPQIITDKKLQADEGSLSRYSMKFSLSYAGPGIGDLENKNRPNPDGVITTNETKISGSIGARYRLDGTQALSLGTGISAIHPFHGWERTDVNDPYLSYDKSSRFGELQLRQIVSVSGVTTPVYRDAGEVAAVSYEVDLVRNVGDTRLAVGWDSKVDWFFYERGYRPTKTDKGAAQNYLSFYPNMKYQFSDRMNMNTSLAIMFYNPRELKDGWAMWNRTLTQRIGIGYSYRRDVYLSPYITIYPTNFHAANTTFNLGATFSML